MGGVHGFGTAPGCNGSRLEYKRRKTRRRKEEKKEDKKEEEENCHFLS